MLNLQTNAQSSAHSLHQQQVHFTAPKSHRFLFLDALRGIAALFVVGYHLSGIIPSSFAANAPLAVDFFFCLSGFVIAFTYENRLAENLSFKDFAVARWIRLYPIYALGSLLGFLVLILVQHYVFHAVESWSASLSFFTLALFLWPTCLSPLSQPINYPLNIPAWSLFYEILANFAYALLVKLRIARTSVLLCIVAGNLALLAHVIYSGGILDVGARQAGFGLGFARVAFSFVVGVLLCRLYRFRAHSRSTNTDTHRTHWLLPLAITLALIAILNSPFSWMRTEAFRITAIALCFPAMVYYGAVSRLPRAFARPSTVLGELSYPLYLLHQPFVSMMTARRLSQFLASHPTLIAWFGPCLIAILALLSWWVGERVDLPIRRALTRLYNSKKPLPPISRTSIPDCEPAQQDGA